MVQAIKEESIDIVDLRFMDFPGLWQHFSVPPREIDEDSFENGLGFDGSSIRGWQVINESDMLVKPVPETAFIDPFFQAKTLVMICNICDPVTGEDYTRDPRNIARKARHCKANVDNTRPAWTAWFYHRVVLQSARGLLQYLCYSETREMDIQKPCVLLFLRGKKMRKERRGILSQIKACDVRPETCVRNAVILSLRI